MEGRSRFAVTLAAMGIPGGFRISWALEGPERFFVLTFLTFRVEGTRLGA